MSVLIPTPSLLAAHWPLQDSVGDLSLDQVIVGTGTSGDVPPFTVYPGTAGLGYPLTVSGPGGSWPSAKRFSASEATAIPQWWGLYYPWPSDIEYCQTFEGGGSGPACWVSTNGDDLNNKDKAISVRFKRHTNAAAPIFGIGNCYDTTQQGKGGMWYWAEPLVFFYFGASGNLHFGFSGWSYFTTRKDSINSGQTYLDGEWHEAVGTIRIDDRDGRPLRTFARCMDLYVDGIHLGTVSHGGGIDDWTGVNPGDPTYYPFFIGSGFMYNTTTLNHYPDSAPYDVSNGACGADLCDARVYCGSVVPGIGPAISSIMFSCNT